MDSGTSALTCHAVPGPVSGAHLKSGKTVNLPTDVAARLLLAAQCGMPLLPSDVKQRLAPLLTYESMAVIAGSLLAIGAAHAFGIGFAADILVGTVVIATIGQDAIEAASHAKSFYSLAINASSQDEFDRAGQAFASFVTIIGINTLLILLMRARPAPKVSQLAAVGESTRAGWMAYIGKIKFNVPSGKAILWSQIGARPAEVVARGKGLVSLEMLLKEEGFLELYSKQFGKTQSSLTGDIWREISKRYAASLEGKVTAYVHERRLAAEFVKRAEPMLQSGQKGINPVLVDELEEIAEIMLNNSKITSVEMIDVSSGRTWLMLREEVINAAKTTH
ncbi:hypothetical protein [Pseudoduganella sp. OTU4001]|uniref:hypothetical protein n=1 Tax=Pseudoduganella sp. OTU4001 TaxID=3043854 RepID=UPI00313C80CB